MDFVARASNVLERSQRLTGVLLIICVIEAIMLLFYFSGNKDLNMVYRQLREESKVYVVPGSTMGLYAPTRRDFLLKEFSGFVAQSFNTFTFDKLQAQYREAKKFFSPNMAAASEGYFGDLINKALQDQRSALFIPTQGAYRVTDEKTQSGSTVRKVVMYGHVQYILRGRVLEQVPLRLEMKFSDASVTQTNAFGYVLESYKSRGLRGTEAGALQRGNLDALF